MQLIVSLPRNDVTLALAAASEGADAIKLHMNVEHRASGTRFGSFAEERDTVLNIMSLVKCELGLMPGADAALPSREELMLLHGAGLAFIDIYAHHMPLWMLSLPMNVIAAISHQHADCFLSGSIQPGSMLETGIHMLEASICCPDDYGKPFSYQDLLQIIALREAVDVPILVPTQKAIRPDEARLLAQQGIEALMIGAVVTGDSVESIARATSRYRTALDAD